MSRWKLGCLWPRVGATFLVLCSLAVVGAPAMADDPWPPIRADYREGRFEAALDRLAQLVAIDPDDREAWYYLGLINWRLERWADAATAYRHVLTLDPHGPFGHDAELWLSSYGPQASRPASPTPSPVPSRTPAPPRPTPIATPTPPPIAAATPAFTLPPPTLPPPTPPPATTRPGWLTAEPRETTSRPRSRNARPGYFKAADGTFEFVPPRGFVLMEEGADGNEQHALFGLEESLRARLSAVQPPTLLMVWRELPDLAAMRPDARSARERQLLAMEAASYGPGARLEAHFGVPTYRVLQRQGPWAAETLLFFQNGRLYAITYGGAADKLPQYGALVAQSLGTPIFYR